MGRWIYEKDETTIKDLKKMATKLMNSLITAKIEANVQFSKNITGAQVDITFFKGNDSFTITLYAFYKIEKNEELTKIVQKLFKNPNKFDEIKKDKRL